jgi:hypothetical protein
VHLCHPKATEVHGDSTLVLLRRDEVERELLVGRTRRGLIVRFVLVHAFLFDGSKVDGAQKRRRDDDDGKTAGHHLGDVVLLGD